MSHLSKDLIERFFALSTSREENRQLVRHILSGCPACVELLRSLIRPAVDPKEYERLLDSFCQPRKHRIRDCRRRSSRSKGGCPSPFDLAINITMQASILKGIPLGDAI